MSFVRLYSHGLPFRASEALLGVVLSDSHSAAFGKHGFPTLHLLPRYPKYNEIRISLYLHPIISAHRGILTETAPFVKKEIRRNLLQCSRRNFRNASHQNPFIFNIDSRTKKLRPFFPKNTFFSGEDMTNRPEAEFLFFRSAFYRPVRLKSVISLISGFSA